MQTSRPTAKPAVVAVFGKGAAAQECLRALRAGGFGEAELGFLGPAFDDSADPDDQGTVAGAAAGSVTGGVIGGVVGAVVAGLVPGVGPVVAGGLLAGVVAGAPAGAAIGGVAGTLRGAGVSAQDAVRYEKEVLAGRYLVTVRTRRPGPASRLIRLHGGELQAPVTETPVVGVFEAAEIAEAVAEQLRQAYPDRRVTIEEEPGRHLRVVEPERRQRSRLRVRVRVD